MKKGFFALAICILVSNFNQAKAGFIYEDTIYPILATNMETDNIKTLKKGECQIFHCWGIIDTGYAGIQNAATRAGITKIHHVDIKNKLILGIGMTTVQVYGE